MSVWELGLLKLGRRWPHQVGSNPRAIDVGKLNPGKQDDVDQKTKTEKSSLLQESVCVCWQTFYSLSYLFWHRISHFSVSMCISMLLTAFLKWEIRALTHLLLEWCVFRLPIIIHHKSGRLTVARGYLFIIYWKHGIRILSMDTKWFAIVSD